MLLIHIYLIFHLIHLFDVETLKEIHALFLFYVDKKLFGFSKSLTFIIIIYWLNIITFVRHSLIQYIKHYH